MAKAKKPGTALVNWDEEMAKQAVAAKTMEDSTATGQFFSVRAGQLSFNGAPVPGNRMGVVILDAVMENVFYEGEFNPDQPTSPTCYAFGRSLEELAPHEQVDDKQSDKCQGCPMNEFGTADKGRGKACRNTRRLALLPAGTFKPNGDFELIADPKHYETAQAAFLKLPVTSVRGYSGFVKSASVVMHRPPHGIATCITVQPDPKNQVAVTFEPLEKMPNAVMAAIMKRHDEMRELIAFPYQKVSTDDKTVANTKAGRGTRVQKNVRPAVKRGPKKF